MTREQLLDEAKRIVCADREGQYGAPEDNFALIARLWEDYLRASCVGPGSDVSVGSDDVANMMVLLKVARAGTALHPKADNWVDIAGYAACAAEIATEERNNGQV